MDLFSEGGPPELKANARQGQCLRNAISLGTSFLPMPGLLGGGRAFSMADVSMADVRGAGVIFTLPRLASRT